MQPVANLSGLVHIQLSPVNEKNERLRRLLAALVMLLIEWALWPACVVSYLIPMWPMHTYSSAGCLHTSPGGNMTLGDSFTSSLFKQTYQKVFSKDHKGEYNMAFNGTFTVKVRR